MPATSRELTRSSRRHNRAAWGSAHSLYEAVCQAPDDDAPRLAMAVALARSDAFENRNRADFITLCLAVEKDRNQRRRRQIGRRLGSLFGGAVSLRLWPDLSGLLDQYNVGLSVPYARMIWGGYPYVHFARGFADTLRARSADVLTLFGRGFLTRYPVTQIRLDDDPDAEGWDKPAAWRSGSGPGRLPPAIFDRLAGGERGRGRRMYPTVEAADAAAGRAVLQYGRELAGLPPMPEAVA